MAIYKNDELQECWSQEGPLGDHTRLLGLMEPMVRAWTQWQVRKWETRYSATLPTREDLDQEMLLASLRAARTYDPTRSKLSTHVQNQMRYAWMKWLERQVHPGFPLVGLNEPDQDGLSWACLAVVEEVEEPTVGECLALLWSRVEHSPGNRAAIRALALAEWPLPRGRARQVEALGLDRDDWARFREDALAALKGPQGA